MSRPSSGGFILGFAAEIAVVVAAVSILPRFDLSGRGSEFSAAAASQPAAAFHETAHWERPAAPSERPPAPASLPPRLAFVPPTVPAPTETRQPPPLIAVDPARPAYVEQRLDRASQGLVNGLGSYASHAAEKLLRSPVHSPVPLALPQPPPRPQPLEPPQRAFTPLYQQPSLPGPTASTGSFATQSPATGPPRPWMRY